MYSLVTVKDTVRIPPRLFSQNIDESVIKALREQHEGKLDHDMGVVVAVLNPRDVGDGKIVPGDGAAYHDTVFDVLVFKPEVNELIKAKVTEITEFGAFLRFGPIDGLVHVSQVTDDFMSFNAKAGSLSGKDSKKILQKGDEVLARVTAVSMKATVTESKINLTMRQLGLGKEGWERVKKERVEPAKKKKSEK